MMNVKVRFVQGTKYSDEGFALQLSIHSSPICTWSIQTCVKGCGCKSAE